MRGLRYAIPLSLMLWMSVYAAWASPFLVCDPAPHGIGLNYEVISNGKIVFTGPNEPDGSIKVDLKDIPAGDYSYTARYIKIDPLWGTAYSAESPPCVFTRPVAILPIKLVNPRLLK